MAIDGLDVEAAAGSGREKRRGPRREYCNILHQIQPACVWRRPNLSREIKFSGENGDRGSIIDQRAALLAAIPARCPVWAVHTKHERYTSARTLPKSRHVHR